MFVLHIISFSQLVLNLSDLVPDVFLRCRRFSRYRLLRRLAVFFSSSALSFKQVLAHTVALCLERTATFTGFTVVIFFFFFFSSPHNMALCALKSRFLELAVGTGPGRPRHVIMNNRDNRPSPSVVSSSRQRRVRLRVPGLSRGARRTNGAQ